MITILSISSLYFLFQLKSRFENSRFQISVLDPIKSKNTAFIKRTPRSSALSHQTPYCLRHQRGGASPSTNCSCLLHVLRHPPLCSVASNTSRGLQPRTHLHLQPLLFLCTSPPSQNSIAAFLLLVDPINFMAGEENSGKCAVEEVLEENMPVNQRLRRLR